MIAACIKPCRTSSEGLAASTAASSLGDTRQHLIDTQVGGYILDPDHAIEMFVILLDVYFLRAQDQM